MIPCLYDVSETEYRTNGIGKLSDCTSCTVTEKRNGSYELKMTYPTDGIHAESLTEGNIILAKPADNRSSQPFRIYKVTADLSGSLEIAARHISYQLNDITVSPTTVVTGTHDQVNAAFAALKENATTDCPFSFETDLSSDAYFGILEPVSFRSALGGVDGSMLDTFGGEFEWDFYTVRLWKSRGADHGVRIVYGKNLTDFKEQRDAESVITGVHPYWKDSETGDVTELPEKVITLENSGSPYERIGLLDCSSEFEEEPTWEQLRSYAQSYLTSTTATEPNLDIDIDFAQLWQTPGYEDIVEAERVSLCDTVHVYITKLGIEVSTVVTETEYDVLLERYQSITLSNSPTSSRNSSLALTVATTSQVKSLIAVTDSSIRLSVSGTYATKATLENNYSTTVEVKSLIALSEEDITLSFDKKLKNDYSTTEEIQSLIRLSEEGILLEFDKYSTTEEVQSLIQASEEGITLSFDKKLTDDYSTTEEVQSLIQASEEGITLSFDKKLTDDYSTTEEVQSLIKASEEGISLSYVKNGEVRSRFALEEDGITIETGGTIAFKSNRLVIDSTYTSLSSTGVFECSSASVSGKLAAVSSKYTVDMTSGMIHLYYGDDFFGMLTPVADSSSGTPVWYGINGSSSNVEAVTIGLGSTAVATPYILIYNRGSWGGYTDRIQLLADTRVTGRTFHNNHVYLGDTAHLYCGTIDGLDAVWDFNAFYVAGDLLCAGTKYRVVDTEHYGKIGMNSFETASALFGDFGSGTIGADGQITVFFASEFQEVIDENTEYQVFVTQGSAGSLSHVEKNPGSFTVFGEPGTEFDWFVAAHQRDYVMNRLETVNPEAGEDIPFDESVFYGDRTAEEEVSAMAEQYERKADLL